MSDAALVKCGEPGALLVHGFPELAYSCRKVRPARAEAGFHVFAPDLRGYGHRGGYDENLAPFPTLNRVRDLLAPAALGHRFVAAIVGHDFRSPTAGWCAPARPDMFRWVVMTSAPFGGPPRLPFDTLNRPATREANADTWHAPQNVHAFLRACYHIER